MSEIINLPADLETALTAEAARRGLSLQEYALRILATKPEPAVSFRTGAELVAYWKREGLIGTAPEIGDSVAHARMIRH